MSSPDVLAYVRAALPPPPARVLEVGAGSGELAAALAGAGYDVVAIDPAGDGAVRPVALLDLDEPPASFDAAVAVVSLHHVEPLEPSCAHLGALVRPAGRLVVDEFDVAAFDERAAEWLCARRRELGLHAPDDPDAMVADLRAHLHTIDAIRTALSGRFALGPGEAGPYLHRWDLAPALQATEEEAIAAGRLPAVGVRFTGARR